MEFILRINFNPQFIKKRSAYIFISSLVTITTAHD